MVKVKTIKAFYDLHMHVDHRPGDVFEVSEERFERLDVLLPGYIEREVDEDYSSMTLQQLTEIAKERGVLPKRRVSKAALVELLSKE